MLLFNFILIESLKIDIKSNIICYIPSTHVLICNQTYLCSEYLTFSACFLIHFQIVTSYTFLYTFLFISWFLYTFPDHNSRNVSRYSHNTISIGFFRQHVPHIRKNFHIRVFEYLCKSHCEKAPISHDFSHLFPRRSKRLRGLAKLGRSLASQPCKFAIICLWTQNEESVAIYDFQR